MCEFQVGLHRPAFFYIRYPAGYPVSFARYLAGYRISGSSIDEIVDIESNVNFIVLI